MKKSAKRATAAKRPKSRPKEGWPAAWWPIDRVRPYERNPRKNASAIQKVRASLREFGWRQPIVVDESGVVLAGHTRLLAAREEGLSQVPVHVATGLSAAQAKAYRLADNRTAQEAEWDLPLLSGELTELKALDFDLALTGFDDDEVARLMDEAPSYCVQGV